MIESSRGGAAGEDGAAAGASEPITREEVRETIVAQAKTLFAHYGYKKTNIGDIAAACHMSPSNLYRYFRNKQGIAHAVVAQFLVEHDQRIQAALARPARCVEQRLRCFVTESVMFMVEHIRRAPKLVELAESLTETTQGMAVIESRSTARQTLIHLLIEEGARAGEFAPPDTAAAARAVAMGTKFFQAPYAIARHGLDRVEEDLAVTLDLLCAGLRSTTPPSRSKPAARRRW